MNKSYLYFIHLLLLVGLAIPSQASYTWIGGADIWSDPANWDCTCVPGPGDEVMISSGAVDLSGALITVHTVILTGGTILDGGGGKLTTTTMFAWSGGTIFAEVTILGSAMDIGGAATKTLKGELTITAGSMVGWAAGTIDLDGGVIFNAGIFAVESDADIIFSSLLGLIENEGVFVKVAGAGTSTISAFFKNVGLGIIEVKSGTLLLDKGILNEADIVVDPGTILDIDFEGEFVFGSDLSGMGTVKFSGDTSHYKVDYFGTVDMEFSEGVTMIFEGLVETSGDVLVDDATLEGPGGLLVSGSATWKTGEIQTDCILIITGSLAMSTTGIKKIYGTLDLDGPCTWTGGIIELFGAGGIENSASFTTDFDGIIESATPGVGFVGIEASGTFEKTAGGGTTTIEPSVTNYGMLKASADTISLEGTFSNYGTAHAPASSSLNIIGGSTWYAGSDMTGTGEIIFYDNDNTFAGTLTTENKIMLHLPGKIIGAGELICETSFDFVGGTLEADLTIESGASFDIYSAASKIISSTVNQKGTAKLFSSATSFNINMPGSISNLGTFILDDGADIDHTTTPGSFSNSGILRKSSSKNSLMTIGLTNNEGGIIEGIGTLNPTASFTNNGIVSPGTSPGILTLDSDFTNGTELRIEMEDGTGAGTGHDQLLVTGTISLGDTLVVTETGTVPDGTYTIASCSGGPACLSGTFEKVTLPTHYTINYTATSVTLTKTTVLPVELTQFQAKASAADVVLLWTTASEVNNDYFRVQRSFDGQRFETIAVVMGAGDSRESNHYQHRDYRIRSDASGQALYYRLQQVDRDGQWEYSEVIAVSLTHTKEVWSVRATPAVGSSIQLIYFAPTDELLRLEIFDQAGRPIYQQKEQLFTGYGRIHIPTYSWSSGIYTYRFTAGNFRQVEQIFYALP